MSLKNYTQFLNESNLHESAMMPGEWRKDDGKYRKQFLQFLDDPSKSLNIDPKFSKNYKFNSFKVKDIENLADVKIAVESGTEITAKGPMAKVNGEEVSLVHLQKTGVFSTGAPANSTDVKEGMVVYFYYNQDLDFFLDLSASEQAVNRIHSDSLSSKALDAVKNFISNADDDKKTVTAIAEWQSAGRMLKPFADAGFHINRGKLFNEIRKKAVSLSTISAEDNWCPGDVYIYNPNVVSAIVDTVKNAKLIGELNLLFNGTFEPINSNSAIASIWAVSLKQSEARVGKAKEWVIATAPKDAVYNLTKEEQAECKKSLNWGRTEIAKYQESITNLVKSSDIKINYQPGDVAKIDDASVQSKLAAIKLTYYLITIPGNSAKDIDSNLLAVLKFGLKQSDPLINPPYFKVIGSKSGDGDLKTYNGGDTLALLIKGIDSKETMVSIIDRPTRKDILLYYYASKNSIAYEYELKVGTSGNVQANVEFQGERLIGDMNADPAGITQQVISLFNKRSS